MQTNQICSFEFLVQSPCSCEGDNKYAFSKQVHDIRQIYQSFSEYLDPTVSDRVRMVATVLSGKDLALEVRSDLKRKVRS